MIRNEDLRLVLDTYVRVPETPATPSSGDRTIARRLLAKGVPPERLLHAIRLATHADVARYCREQAGL